MKKPVTPSGRCAVVFHSADHEPVATALARRCEAEDLKVYVSQATGEAAPTVFAQVKADGLQPGGHAPAAAAVADACWQLHQQHPSTWTHEVDLQAAQARDCLRQAETKSP